MKRFLHVLLLSAIIALSLQNSIISSTTEDTEASSTDAAEVSSTDLSVIIAFSLQYTTTPTNNDTESSSTNAGEDSESTLTSKAGTTTDKDGPDKESSFADKPGAESPDTDESDKIEESDEGTEAGTTINQPTESSKQPTKPLKQPNKPSKQPTKPLKQPNKPSKQPTKSSKDPTKPSKPPTKPLKQPNKPSKKPTKTSKQPTKPSYTDKDGSDAESSRADKPYTESPGTDEADEIEKADEGTKPTKKQETTPTWINSEKTESEESDEYITTPKKQKTSSSWTNSETEETDELSQTKQTEKSDEDTKPPKNQKTSPAPPPSISPNCGPAGSGWCDPIYICYDLAIWLFPWKLEQCLKERCPLRGPNEEFNSCETCEPYCGYRLRMFCTVFCKKGCGCKNGYCRDIKTEKCIKE